MLSTSAMLDCQKANSEIEVACRVKKDIADGDPVRLFSARGEVPMKARISTEVKPGILYCTFHFPEVLVNIVTSSECDEDTMCPEYKVVAVDVEKVTAPVKKAAIVRHPEPVMV